MLEMPFTWKNNDSLTHTVTIGTMDEKTGFDSGLILLEKIF